MSLLEEQLKELGLKQRKVNLLKEILASAVLTSKLTKNPTEEEDADDEVKEGIRGYIQDQIDMIENGKALPDVVPPVSFTTEEVNFIKEMVQRAQQRGITAQAQQVQGAYSDDGSEEQEAPKRAPPQRRQTQPNQQKQKVGGKDALTFAMEHRHLNGRRVIAHTKDGKVGGTVTGAEVPHLWIHTDTGHRVPVLPENLTLE